MHSAVFVRNATLNSSTVSDEAAQKKKKKSATCTRATSEEEEQSTCAKRPAPLQQLKLNTTTRTRPGADSSCPCKTGTSALFCSFGSS